MMANIDDTLSNIEWFLVFVLTYILCRIIVNNNTPVAIRFISLVILISYILIGVKL